jgi:phage terminase small subunit
MGRPRTPVATLKLTGGFRKDRHEARVDDKIATGTPAKPLDLDPTASRVWDTVMASLSAKALRAADQMVLVGCCVWYSRWVEFDRQIAQGQGDPYKLMVMAGVAWKNFMAAAAKIGITPVDRTKLDVPVDEKPEDGKAKFFG